MPAPPVLWSPREDAPTTTRVGRYVGWLERERGLRFETYDDLWRWSTSDLAAFWQSVWDHLEVRPSSPAQAALADARMPGATWFPGAQLNWAEHALRLAGRDAADTVVIARSQTRERSELTVTELRDQVARVRAGLVRLGVAKGDRVAGYLPNVPEDVTERALRGIFYYVAEEEKKIRANPAARVNDILKKVFGSK